MLEHNRYERPDNAGRGGTVVLIAREFQPVNNGPSARAQRFARALLGEGYEVLVVTRGPQAQLHRPLPALLICPIEPDGTLPPEIAQSDVPRWPGRDKLPGPDADRPFSLAAYRAGLWLLEQYQGTMVIATGPPFSVLAVGVRVAQNIDRPLLLDLRDAWYTGMNWPYRSKTEQKTAQEWERTCLARAKRITIASEAIRRSLAEAFGEPVASKLAVVRHGYDVTRPLSGNEPLDPIEAREREFVIAHVGWLPDLDAMTAGRLPESVQSLSQVLKNTLLKRENDAAVDWGLMSPRYLLEAVARLLADNLHMSRQVKVVFSGPRYDCIDTWARELKIGANVRQRGVLPLNHAQHAAAQANVLVLPLFGLSGCDYHWCVPSKLYTYMGTGNPILGLLPAGEARDILARAGTGFFAPPDDVEAIALTLRELLKQHTAGGIAVKPNWDYIERFQTSRQMKRFLARVEQAKQGG